MFRKTKVCTGLMLAFGGSLAVTSSPSFAQQTLERVEITGSSIKRVEAEGALPVQVVTREDIARSGVTSVEQLLQTVSATSTSGGLVASQGAGLSIYGRSEVSLRGLSSERTLVLVNGRRVAAFAGGGGAAVNVSAIPLGAIDRIEVLKDGASSIYGSDAMGGVINFILSKNYQGLGLDATYGTPTRSGGGQNTRVNLVGGLGDLSKDRYNVTVSASFEKERQLRSIDRKFAATGNVYPYLVSGATGQGNIEGAYTPGTGSVANGNWVEGTRQPGFGGSPGTGYGNPLAAANNCEAINMFRNPTDTSKGVPFCAYDSARFIDGLIPERKSTNLSANLAVALADSVELFGDALYSENVVTQRIQPSPVRRSFLTPADSQFLVQGVDPALLIFPTNPNYKIAADYLNANGFGSIVGQPLAITSRVMDFGPRTSKDTATQSRLVAGIRGSVLKQDYEAAASYNVSKLAGSVIDGYFSQVAYAKIIQTSDDWNPWSLTQTDAFNAKLPDAKYVGPTLKAKSKSVVLDAKVSGDVVAVPGGMSQYAVGLQRRDESYVTNPSAALESGDIAGLGGGVPAIDKSRKITSLFGELIVPILKSVEGNVAARSDRYNDVGSSSTYKGSLRWQPMSSLVVRASTGTGFRAPTLSNLWTPQTVGTSAQFTDPAFPATPNLQVPELSGGNPDVKPEKSKQNSIGIVFEPSPSFTVGVDYWTIDIEDIISTPSTQEIVTRFRQGDPAYAGLVTLGPNGEVEQTKSILANVGSAKVAGVDLSVNFRQALALGKLDLGLNGTYMTKFDQTTPGGTVSRKVGTIVDPNGDPVLGADTGGVVLRWKHRLSATWTQGPWGLTLAQNYYSGYETGRRQIDGERTFVGTQSIYDAQVAYTGVKNLKLALGVKNLFDKNPPLFVPVSNQFQAGYDVTQYDPRARFIYATVGYKFF
jgi:iron complex outermembrane receptor protein